MSKIKELEKRKIKLENELSKARERLKKQQESIVAKEDEIKRVEAELFSTLLTENNLTFSELKEFLSDTKKEKTEQSIQENVIGGENNV